MGNVFTKNIGWKIASIVIAFFIWFSIVRVEDPYITKEFKNIPVKVLNETIVTSKNQYINYIEGEYVDVTLGGNRRTIESLKNDDITATVDMQYLSFVDTLVIEIDPGHDGVKVVRKKPYNMRIEKENVKAEIRTVVYEFAGSPKESYVHLDPIIKPNKIEIEGPESKVTQVTKVLVTLGIDGATSDVISEGKVRLLDSDGNVVDNVEMRTDKVDYQVPIRKLKEVNLVVNTTGNLPPGYKLISKEVVPKKITLIGTEKEIDKINNVTIDIPLNNVNADVNKEIDLSTILPEGVSRYQESNIVNVKLNVNKVEEKEVAILTRDITIESLPENYNMSIVDTEDIKVRFRGIQEDLDKISITSLNPKINLNNLEEGRHEVALTLTYPRNVELITEIPKVIIELTKQEPGDDVTETIQNTVGNIQNPQNNVDAAAPSEE